jgi:hypothetical protein
MSISQMVISVALSIHQKKIVVNHRFSILTQIFDSFTNVMLEYIFL